MTVDQLLNIALNGARAHLIGQPDASLMAAFMIQYKDQPPVILGAPWSCEEEKQMALSLIRFILNKDPTIHSYSFISEAWVAEENAKHPIGLMPSQREDKREVVIISAFDRQGGETRVYVIERGPDGRVSDLVLDPHTVFEGRVHNLFANKDSHAN